MKCSDFLNKELVEKLIMAGVPLGHFESTNEEAIRTGDLGLGFIYYAMVRIFKPKNVVVIGSYRGYSVICFALGLAHNGIGVVHFIDSSEVDDFWKDKKRAEEHFSRFGVKRYIRLYNETTETCLKKLSIFSSGEPFIDILFIDGDHSLRGVSFDYFKFGALVKKGGFICLHDSFVGGMGKSAWQVAEFLSSLHIDLYESLTIETAKGLTIIKKLDNELISSEHIRKKARIEELLYKIREQNVVDELHISIRDLIKDITDYERILEMRYRFLVRTNKSMLGQIAHLKLENKRLHSLLTDPSRQES